ncbi:hypothetical protein [Micromonospora sp. RV43]|uniref:hypothetical protein n=1 Tax=Micromonospora sp. RV43 TaxID=1661387 RepID=UPI00064C2F56|nr:hypothetical protein [Micromonospora sp. RV43]
MLGPTDHAPDGPPCTLAKGTCYCTRRAGCLAINEDDFLEPDWADDNSIGMDETRGRLAGLESAPIATNPTNAE